MASWGMSVPAAGTILVTRAVAGRVGTATAWPVRRRLAAAARPKSAGA